MNLISVDSSIDSLNALLQEKSWLVSEDESISSVTVPGEGNMNVVIRAKTNHRSIILKQSRPYVQKYPSIPAPVERIDVEYQFYASLQDQDTSAHMPRVIGYDKDENLLLLEDLGEVNDMTRIYDDSVVDDEDLKILVEVLAGVHEVIAPNGYPKNIELRELNHQHIFVLPFMEDNGFDLDDVQPGLQALSKMYKSDDNLKSIVSKIGEQYLSEGDVMLHGDYYPGSWMKTDEQLFVLDPEFSFVGFREFDLGVMIGHCLMATADNSIISRVLDLYPLDSNRRLVQQVAGIEIMRRIIGLAQLPLDRSIQEKKAMLAAAYKLIV